MAGRKATIIIILILALALLVAVGYILYGRIQNSKLINQQQVFTVGYNQGLTAAVTALAQQTNNCQPAVITLGNFSRQVIDVACLQKAA